MSVQSFVNAAQVLYNQNFYEEALCLACIAVDSAATLAYPQKGVTERYKLFLKDNFRTISEVGFPGISAAGIRIKVNSAIDNLKCDQNGYVDMEQIIYHVLRCGLVHGCNIDNTIKFTGRTFIGNDHDGKFYLPETIIWGLLAAVENNILKQV